MPAPVWFRPPRQVLTIFLIVAAFSAAALGGLAWQLLEQDRDLETQRQQVRLDQKASALAAAMQQALAELEAHLGAARADGSPLPPDVLAVTMAPDGIVTIPEGSLLYYPASTERPLSSSSAVFAEGERLEFIAGDLAAAAATYARLAASPSPDVRAAAFMRLGRVQRRRGANDEALRAYASLADLEGVFVEGLPAALVARHGRISVFEDAGRAPELAEEAAALLSDLVSGRWHLTKAQYDTYAAEARRVLPPARADDAALGLSAETAAWLWERRGVDSPIARRTVVRTTGAALVVWKSTPTRLDGLIAGPRYLSSLGASVVGGAGEWAISDLEGRPILGRVRADGPTAVRLALTTGLPWTLHVFPHEGEALPASPRRTLLVLVLGLVAIVFSIGWFFIYRSITRERQIAAVQSDFVAAVSHEFRSPLTALSHAAELLVNDRLTSDVLRRQTYGVLARDTLRLRTLVEDLLEFGRLEAGATPFRYEDTDVGALVRSTVEAFQEPLAGDGRTITLSGDFDGVWELADREALVRALRNLLDNAVKYSPDGGEIEVTLTRESDAFSIAVRDRGIGIPAVEQRAIFDRFVRGAESKARRIQGTGIGLAMVRQIVRGHGGDVSVASEPGQGSVFTMRFSARASTDVSVGQPGVLTDATASKRGDS